MSGTGDPRDHRLTAGDLRAAADRLYGPGDERLDVIDWTHDTQVRYGQIRSRLRALADSIDHDEAANPALGSALQQWTLAQAVLAAANSAGFRTEILRQRSSEPPAHEITAMRMVRGDEKVFCRCGTVLPIERDGASSAGAVTAAMQQHLTEDTA